MNTTLNRRKALSLAFAMSAALAGASAFAQAYPNKPVKVIVPYNPGANPDIGARIVSQALQERLGQAFVIENRTGAGGSIGTAAGAKSPPDGYTLVIGHVAGMAINPSVYASLQYDPIKDFVPIAQAYKSPLLLAVADGSPYKNIADLVAAAKAKPGELNFSSGGNGTGAHLSGESLAGQSGVTMRHIPYKSVGASLIAVANGEVAFAFGNGALIWPLVQGKKLRVLAFSGDARVAEYPDVPLVAETIKGFEYHDWAGFMAPAGTPADIVAKLQREIAAVVANPEVAKQMRTAGLIPVQSSTELFAKHIAAEGAKWSALAKKINLKLD